MNMKLALDDITRIYETMRASSRQCIENGDYEESLGFIKAAARTAYLFNWIYADEELEEQLKTLSYRMIRSTPLDPRKGRIVLYDSFATDNRGLTQQYIRALKAQNSEFLFIFENENPKTSQAIRAELEQYGKCEIHSMDSTLSLVEWVSTLYERIHSYQPEKLLMHLSPWAAEAIIAFHALAPITKYQINLTDHAFWLGVKCLDYSLEFRDYGCTVSIAKRGLAESQLLINPYYPIIARVPFKGLPAETESRVVIFSGASFYKVYGRNDAFLYLVKRMLDENPEAVIIFAGNGEGRKIHNFIRDQGLERRFILIGNRSDINEVFARCDIYLGTYPIAGGLMSQFAAANAKPIVAFTTPDIPCNFVEGIVCHKKRVDITSTDENLFLTEVRKLVTDKTYRQQKGRLLREALIAPDDFNANFNSIMTARQSAYEWDFEEINYQAFTDLYLEVENNYQDPFKRLFLKTFKVRVLFAFPLLALKSLPKVLFRQFKLKLGLI